jgi:SAM-dependent methyltransferase
MTNDEQSAIYTEALAEGYETIMAHVDYRRWAGYAHDRLQEHAPAAKWPLGPRSVLELGCGTGALTRQLQPRGPYRRYLATDGSEAMLAVARRKARAQSLPVCFRRARFTRVAADLAEDVLPPGHEPPFDAVLLLYDGLNYLLDERRVRRLLAEAARLLRPGGLFLFDQSTPANSAADRAVFEHEGAFERADGRAVRYHRASRYDAARRRHETTFTLVGPDEEQRRTERHVQRPYDVVEIRRLVRASPLAERAAYDGFTIDPPTDRSRRVHWVTQLRGEG